MTDGPSHESPIVAPYSLSVEDFRKKPSNIVPFKEGDRVTRGNFIPFLVHSFSISRGLAEAQKTYVKWVEANYGFDTITAIEHFEEAGAENLLTQQEEDLIVGAFTRVRAHNAQEERSYPLDAFINSTLNMHQYPALKNVGSLRGVPLPTLIQKISEEYHRRGKGRK